MTRIAITADLHVDHPESRRRWPGAAITVREQDALDTTAFVARHGREFECDVLVVAGDYVEQKANPRSGRVTRIARALLEGPDRQIHVPGNHDITEGGLSIVDDLATRAPGWTGHTEPGFELVGTTGICVIPFLEPAWARTLETPELFEGERLAPASMTDAQLFRWLSAKYVEIARGLFVRATDAGARDAILVGHQQLSGGTMAESQHVFLGGMDVIVDSAALASIGFAAVVFGHVHKGQTVIDDPACPVLFAGSIERVDFAEEKEQKSFVVLEVEGGRAKVDRIPTPARHMVTVTGSGAFNEAAVEDSIVRGVDLDPDVDEVDLRRALLAAGALEVMGLRRRPLEAIASVRGLSESLSPVELVEAFYADDPDRDAMVALWRQKLAEVAS